MHSLKERQLTVRASRRPCEYNYTNADIHTQDASPSDGYQFKYPVNWTGDPSTQKVIGLRRISYKPTSINLAFNFIIYDDNNDELPIPMNYVFTADNTFEECLTRMLTDIRQELIQHDAAALIVNTVYNKELGTFNMSIKHKDTHTDYSFKFDFAYGEDSSYNGSDDHFKDTSKIYYKAEFLKLFNQPITKANIDALHNTTFTSLSFNNVWNRDSFYCHASFSDSPRKIIGVNNDLWQTPSVFYDYSDNSNDFNIYFTTDTVHRILPRNGVLLIQLSYIFNYQTSMLTYC